MMLVEARSYVAYYRVSTTRQGESGLGLDAQRAAVTAFVNGHGELAGEYVEIESGKRADRPQLAAALAHAKRCRATLVIAKLDRLGRNVAFVSALVESGTDFLCTDNPHANRLTVHILAAVAEDEARRCSERTKAALAAYKARGGLLGSRHLRGRAIGPEASRKGQQAGTARNRERAHAAYADLLPLMTELRRAGQSYREIGRALSRRGHTTRTGKAWNGVQVRRVLTRAENPQGVS
jgi:DNA invertase Pin-like site-specific DNA recombinase